MTNLLISISSIGPGRLAGGRRIAVAVLAVAWTVTGRTTFAQAGAAGDQGALTPRAKTELLKTAVEHLMAEAGELDVIEKPEVKAQLDRPHPAMTTWDWQMSLVALERMTKKFTGNIYRDTYIRWHLLHAVKMARPEDRLDTGDELVDLIRNMPPPIQARLAGEYRDEPPEIARQYWALWRRSHVRVGYPPFQRDYWGRSALAHVSPERRAELQEIVEEMEKLRPQFRRIRNEEAIAFNRRVRRLNWIYRQYRGELIYELLKTGDPKMVTLVVDEIGRQVKLRQRMAFDLMSFMYLAAFDGVLEQYDDETLAELGRHLKRIARGSEGYFVYRIGEKDPPAYDHTRTRNFADYAFHMVHLLGDIDVVSGSADEAEEDDASDAN